MWGYRIGVVTQNVPPIQCNTPVDVKTDETGDAGASPVSATNLCRNSLTIRPVNGTEKTHVYQAAILGGFALRFPDRRMS